MEWLYAFAGALAGAYIGGYVMYRLVTRAHGRRS